MDEKDFNSLWNKIALIEISNTVSLYKKDGLRIAPKWR